MFDTIENPINESRRILRPIFFGHLDSFVDGDVGRYIREKTQLVDRKAQNIPLDQSDALKTSWYCVLDTSVISQCCITPVIAAE
jgi:hypothetical protein